MMIGLLKRSALLLAVPVTLCLPVAAEAQTVNPFLPMTTKPKGAQNPKAFDHTDPRPLRTTSGVIKPPSIGSRMPVIRPTTPSRMPVIAPAGTPGGNPSVVPK
jgi:hypothetical protein